MIEEEDVTEETIPLEVKITNQPKEQDKTSWEVDDPWEFIEMSEEDIKEAEESRNA